jgi:cytochrome c-type biogenesis protein CcmE
VLGVVLVGAFAFLVAKGIGTSLNYFEPVNQAVAQRASLGNRTFRLEGVVVPGTIRRTARGVDFEVSSSGVRQAVVETGMPPQLFQPDIPVVLVGHFAGSLYLSNEIMVKHTSVYRAATPKPTRTPGGSAR